MGRDLSARLLGACWLERVGTSECRDRPRRIHYTTSISVRGYALRQDGRFDGPPCRDAAVSQSFVGHASKWRKCAIGESPREENSYADVALFASALLYDCLM